MKGVGEDKWKSFSADSDSITLENCPKDYFHILQSLDFRLWVVKYAGSYSQVFTVFLKRGWTCISQTRLDLE